MPGNSFGQIFKLTTFGESHGKAIGGIIDGCPPGLELDFKRIQTELDRRRPGQSAITTQRNESDRVEFLSGILDGKTLGTPIAFLVLNEDHNSSDYEHLKDVYRPSHADYTYEAKYGIRDHRGGGRSSARETVARVVAGAIARQMLDREGVKVWAYTRSIGKVHLEKHYQKLNPADVDQSILRCPDAESDVLMQEYLQSIRLDGDTVGGVISCVIQGLKPGLGEPVFDKLNADLAKAMVGINAVKGFEIGSGFSAAEMRGSQHNDAFNADGSTKTNNSGGIQGGISNGADVHFNVAFKPVATIMQAQQTIDNKGNEVTLEANGRHDPCVVPRAVPIVEAMALLVIADHFLRFKTIA